MNTTQIVDEFPMPADWSSYLINGDASGITDEELPGGDLLEYTVEISTL